MDDKHTPLIKVCGITAPDQAKAFSELGIDLLGLIFYPPSPRNVSVEQAKKIASMIRNTSTALTGVFVNASLEEIERVVRELRLDFVQLHGEETPEFCSDISVPVIKAFRVSISEDLKKAESYRGFVKYILFDAYKKGLPGGTGGSFSWDILKYRPEGMEWFISGGIGPENIGQAADLNPQGIDLNSGVEESPGIKDLSLVRKCLSIIRDHQ